MKLLAPIAMLALLAATPAPSPSTASAAPWTANDGMLHYPYPSPIPSPICYSTVCSNPEATTIKKGTP